MRLRKSSLVVLGAIAGAVAFRRAARAWSNARESARPYAKPTLAGAAQLVEIARGFWRHPEALAMMRNNPEISAPLTDAILASLLQGGRDGHPALADRINRYLRENPYTARRGVPRWAIWRGCPNPLCRRWCCRRGSKR